jgi:hypothetical protein
MSKGRFVLVLITAIVSAFFGGYVSNQIYLTTNARSNDNDKKQNIQSATIHPKFKVIEANQFRLVDPDGKCLAELKIEEDESLSQFSDLPSKEGSTNKSGLDLLKSKKSPKFPKTYRAVLEMGTNSGTMRITEEKVELKKGSTQTILASSGLTIKDKSFISIYVDNIFAGGTAVRISDEKGKTRAVLGAIDLQVMATGETQKRPESSIVLFGKDGKVIYSAP